MSDNNKPISFRSILKEYKAKQLKSDINEETIFVYDFGDGNLVPAHRHANGGGIVANTCNVDADVYLSEDSQIYGNVTIKGKVSISEGCDICGDILIEGVGAKGIFISEFSFIDGDIEIIGSYLIQNSSMSEKVRLKNKGVRRIKHVNKIFI